MGLSDFHLKEVITEVKCLWDIIANIQYLTGYIGPISSVDFIYVQIASNRTEI